MTEKCIITIDNGTSQITVGDDSCDFKLISHSGFAAADFDVKMTAGGWSDGGYISAARLNSRTLGIKFDFGGINGETTRQHLIKFFAPSRKLTVKVQRGAVIRKIVGQADFFDITEKNRYARSLADLSVLCPDPYFKATAAVYYNGAVVTPLFHLPCSLPCILGEENHAADLEIVNSGDTYADMSAELVANTTVTNPFILNKTNGKRIQINSTMAKGSALKISTVRRAKGAAIDGARCLIDPSSQFSDFLEVGLNQLQCGSDEGIDGILASVEYTALFLGV